MEHIISVENMRESDRQTIESGTPSLLLMERAAQGIRDVHAYEGKTAVVVGSGNNGGDGFALALILAREGKSVDVLSVSDHFSGDSSYYRDRARELGVRTVPFSKDLLLGGGYDTVVDCLLGTGSKGEVRGAYREAIEAINDCGAFVISADINSGMNGDTGEYSIAVRSDITVTIGYLKKGLVQACLRGDDAVGSLVRADIGIALSKEEDYLITPQEWRVLGFDDEACEAETDGHTYFKGVLPLSGRGICCDQ